MHPLFGACDTWIKSFSEHILFSLEVERGKGRAGEGGAEKFHIRVTSTLEKSLEPGTTTIHLQNKKKGQHWGMP